MKKEILRMEHICVRHAGRLVLDDFHMNIYEGEFLFVYGFPDSGILELGRILKGTCDIQRGNIFVNEKPVSASSFQDPGQYGIYIVQLDDNLIDDFTIAENLFFGRKKHYFNRTVNKKKQEMMAAALLRVFDLDFDVTQKAGSLTVFQQIQMKLVMAYASGARLVVLEGLVGFINGSDAAALERVLKLLLEDGVSVLWMNQRMDYARQMADRIMLLMKGKNARTIFSGREQVLEKVLDAGIGGRKKTEVHEYSQPMSAADTVFRIDRLSTSWLTDMSFRINKGEIVGICSTTVQAMAEWKNIVCGESQDYSGSMLLDSQIYKPRNYEDSMNRGVCYLDLMWYEKHGNPEMSIEDNMMIGSWWKQKGLRGLLRKRVREHEKVLYRIGHPGWPVDRWSSLSADQQKILLLERLCLEPHRLVVITEPFYQIHQSQIDLFCSLINNIRDNNGAVVLMAVSDYDCRRICDRIIYLDQWVRHSDENEWQGR